MKLEHKVAKLSKMFINFFFHNLLCDGWGEKFKDQISRVMIYSIRLVTQKSPGYQTVDRFSRET